MSPSLNVSNSARFRNISSHNSFDGLKDMLGLGSCCPPSLGPAVLARNRNPVLVAQDTSTQAQSTSAAPPVSGPPTNSSGSIPSMRSLTLSSVARIRTTASSWARSTSFAMRSRRRGPSLNRARRLGSPNHERYTTVPTVFPLVSYPTLPLRSDLRPAGHGHCFSSLCVSSHFELDLLSFVLDIMSGWYWTAQTGLFKPGIPGIRCPHPRRPARNRPAPGAAC